MKREREEKKKEPFSYRDQWVVRGRSGLAKAGLFQVLLCYKGLSQAWEQVLILCGVCQRFCSFLIHFRQTLSPKFHHPVNKHRDTGL